MDAVEQTGHPTYKPSVYGGGGSKLRVNMSTVTCYIHYVHDNRAMVGDTNSERLQDNPRAMHGTSY